MNDCQLANWERKKESMKWKKKRFSSEVHDNWGHDPCSDEFPKLNLSQGHMRGNSWHVGW